MARRRSATREHLLLALRVPLRGQTRPPFPQRAGVDQGSGGVRPTGLSCGECFWPTAPTASGGGRGPCGTNARCPNGRAHDGSWRNGSRPEWPLEAFRQSRPQRITLLLGGQASSLHRCQRSRQACVKGLRIVGKHHIPLSLQKCWRQSRVRSQTDLYCQQLWTRDLAGPAAQQPARRHTGSFARTPARRLTPRRSSGTGDMTPKGLLRHNEYEDVLRREHGKTGVHRSRVTWWPPSDGSAQIWPDLLASGIRESRGPPGPGLQSTARLTRQRKLEGGRDSQESRAGRAGCQPPRARQLGLTDGAFWTLPELYRGRRPRATGFLASLLYNVVVTPENGRSRTVILFRTGRCTRDYAASLRKRSDAAARVGVPPERPRGRPRGRRDVAAPQPVGMELLPQLVGCGCSAASGEERRVPLGGRRTSPARAVSGTCQAHQPHANVGCPTVLRPCGRRPQAAGTTSCPSTLDRIADDRWRGAQAVVAPAGGRDPSP